CQTVENRDMVHSTAIHLLQEEEQEEVQKCHLGYLGVQAMGMDAIKSSSRLVRMAIGINVSIPVPRH
ncbi:hypothetical protein, partial [Klebsiella aerogenes]|uniref:hypothetical protein n=1 Tax=Klebsiella aerogenes TaxID=548 RepID=UPI001CC61248